jgi:hypothetical protein
MTSTRRILEASQEIKRMDAAASSRPDGRESICHQCGNDDGCMPIKCGRCNMVWYCSSDCMKMNSAAHAKPCAESLETSEHTKKNMFDVLPDGRRVIDLLKIRREKKKMNMHLTIQDVEVEPGLYQIPVMADSSISFKIKDERNHKFTTIEAGDLFRYRASKGGGSYAEKTANPRLGPIINLYGNGDLTITFSSRGSSNFSIKVCWLTAQRGLWHAFRIKQRAWLTHLFACLITGSSAR